MSAGLQFIRAILDQGSREAFRRLNGREFTEDEAGVYAYVSQYFDAYSALPSAELLAEQGFYLPDATGTIGYHRDQVRTRLVYGLFQANIENLRGLMARGETTDFVGLLESMVTEMRGSDTQRDIWTLAEAAALVMEDFAEAQRTPGLRGVTFGWPTLDDLTGGARRGDVTTIVARPGQGKSWTIARMACSAWEAGHSVAFVTMEMNAIESARRIIAMGTGVNSDFIQRGDVSTWGQERLAHAVARIPNMAPFNLLVGDLSKSTRDVDAVIQQFEPDVVFIDASYLMRPSKVRPGQKKFEQVSETAQEIRSLSMRHNMPIVQTVQFNRTQKQDEEMSLDNIGQSDEFGQLSAVVLGMKKGVSPYEDTQRVFKVLKNRHGNSNVSFTTRFEFSPFNMDEVPEDGDGRGPDGEWNGVQGQPPAQTEWNPR